MNSYLQIAEAVLRNTTQPLSASEILEAAYRLQLVPEHLFGKTQSKTLQARLSEDLLRNRDRTVFARVAPGRFVLRSRLGAEGQSSEEFIAPLRTYQLKKFDVICADKDELDSIWKDRESFVPLTSVLAAFSKQVPLVEAEKSLHLVHLRLLVSVKNLGRVLTVNSQRDPSYGQGKSFGFLGYLKGVDIDLFSRDHWGLKEASFRTLQEQIGLPRQTVEQLTKSIELDAIDCLRLLDSSEAQNSVVVLTSFECDQPEEFASHIPTHRSPRWVRLPSEINDVSALEPLSKKILANEGALASISS
ncbi:winged helix-turn-helix domain-containing protein [Coralliovum pocilloporae]|uniref:winged helix-turn-helix domain-containing protein n=1 Tax=Coralliovum pocilloporae TaxID=3066369 RepID=UPI003306E744